MHNTVWWWQQHITIKAFFSEFSHHRPNNGSVRLLFLVVYKIPQDSSSFISSTQRECCKSVSFSKQSPAKGNWWFLVPWNSRRLCSNVIWTCWSTEFEHMFPLVPCAGHFLWFIIYFHLYCLIWYHVIIYHAHKANGSNNEHFFINLPI